MPRPPLLEALPVCVGQRPIFAQIGKATAQLQTVAGKRKGDRRIHAVRRQRATPCQ